MQGKKMHGSQIVAHLIDGTIVKGTSLDVDPKRPTCHLRPEAGEAVEIALADVKALFFVKSWSGESGRNDAKKTRGAGGARPPAPRARGGRGAGCGGVAA